MKPLPPVLPKDIIKPVPTTPRHMRENTMAFNPSEHITNLRGKDYLEVKYRLMWFRDRHPEGTIETEVVNIQPLIVRARIEVNGTTIATGLGSANAPQGRAVVWDGREVEKAETAAIGRALAHAGFGTQFADVEEGDHLADSPVERPSAKPTPLTKTPIGREAPKPDTTKAKVEGAIDEALDFDGTFAASKALVKLDKNNKPYIVLSGTKGNSASVWTRSAIVGVIPEAEGWKTPDTEHIIEPPVTVYYKNKDGYKNFVRVETDLVDVPF